MKAKKNKNGCAKYGMAITNYVLGEELGMPQEELFAHLRTCAKCRAELLDWNDKVALFKTEAHFKKPEVQAKYQQMLESIKKGEAPCVTAPLAKNEKLIDTDWAIGHYAGELHKFLGKAGKLPTDQVIRQTGFDQKQLERLIGWLAAERKICLSEDNKVEYVYLKPQEQKLYRQENRPQV
jgi:hypothetical protein